MHGRSNAFEFATTANTTDVDGQACSRSRRLGHGVRAAHADVSVDVDRHCSCTAAAHSCVQYYTHKLSSYAYVRVEL